MSPERVTFLVSLVLFLCLQFCLAADNLTTRLPLKDGDLLVSSNGTFALGFFSPGRSKNRYLGIWYNKVPELTVVWVANRDNPINDTSGVLSIDRSGNLVVYGPDPRVPVWSSNVSNAYSARLLDSGNFVVFQGGSRGAVAWQSFDYPTDTMLPTMKLGVDRKTGLNRFLSSWRSRDDPGTGEFSFKVDLNGSPQFFLNKGPVRVWRTGPWNGLRWSGVPEMTRNFIFNVSYVDNQDELTVTYTINDSSIFTRLMVNESGVVERLTWHVSDRQWRMFWSAPKDQCDQYSYCGRFGECDPFAAGEFECKCLPGFEPRSTRDWYLRDGSGGCTRKRGEQTCGDGEGFVRLTGAKIPDSSTAVVNQSLGLKECREECLRNCSCTGYTIADVTGAVGGCIAWYGDMIDTREFSSGGQDLYVRVDAQEFALYSKSEHPHGKKTVVAITVASAAFLLLVICLLCWLVVRKIKGTGDDGRFLFSPNNSSAGKDFNETGTNSDLPFFDLKVIVAATDNFSSANKLGQGGFGTVYKGRLHSGQEIAVKRLAKNSGQGLHEFKNEVTLIAKLQHRNLVRLIGCCVQCDEKMLIYEYLPNKGLDSFIFDTAKGSFLDWGKRFDITMGIARGMLYLHQDSRLRIIHRDLKASNVLLDASMNPKISDFGMARIFGGDQIEANTNRVVGTYGYMSPEYAMEGLFSIKSDVFGFGVLLLEIISGRKNSSYYQDSSVNLIGHVWDLWKDGKALELVDPSLGDSFPAGEVLRCIHIGLLCVQELATDRPAMSDVAFMLCNETELPPPNQPAFIFKTSKAKDSSSTSTVGLSCSNDVTLTEVQAR